METPEPVPVLTPVPDNGLGLRRHALVCLLSILLSILLHCGAMVALEHVSMHGPAMAETNRPTQPELPPMRIETFAREAGLNTPPAIAEPDITEAARRSAQTTAAKAEALPAPTPLAVAGFIVVGFGCGPVYPCIIHSTPNNFGAENSGAIIGIQMASAYVGSTFIPPLFGLLGRRIGFSFLPWYLAAFVLLMILMTELTFRLTRQRKTPADKE